MNTKKCCRCKKVKPKTEYSWDKRNGGRCYSWCKECARIVSKQWREKNQEKIKEDRLKYKEKQAESARKHFDKKHFGGNKYIALTRDNYKCTKCGVDKNLLVHHIDGKGRPSANKNNNINNLITLCQPCHIKRHSVERKKELADLKKRIKELESKPPKYNEDRVTSLIQDYYVDVMSYAQEAITGVTLRNKTEHLIKELSSLPEQSDNEKVIANLKKKVKGLEGLVEAFRNDLD